MTQNPISPISEPRHDDRTSRTDDEHVVDMVLLPPPEHLIRFFPIQGTPVEALVAGTRSRIRSILKGRTTGCSSSSGPARSTTRRPRSTTRGASPPSASARPTRSRS